MFKAQGPVHGGEQSCTCIAPREHASRAGAPPPATSAEHDAGFSLASSSIRHLTLLRREGATGWVGGWG